MPIVRSYSDDDRLEQVKRLTVASAVLYELLRRATVCGRGKLGASVGHERTCVCGGGVIAGLTA